MIPISNTELYTFRRNDFEGLNLKEKVNKAYTNFKIDINPIKLGTIKLKFKKISNISDVKIIVHFFSLSAGEQTNMVTLDSEEKIVELDKISTWRHDPFFVRNIIFYPENNLLSEFKFKVTAYK